MGETGDGKVSGEPGLTRVYWDSMLFVYLLEGHPTFGPIAAGILKEMLERQHTLCTSVFSVGEVLTGPRKMGLTVAVDRVAHFFSSSELEVLPFDLRTADQFSKVRAQTGATPADAIHLATAALAGVDVFLTNDKQLQRMIVPGIKFIAALDRRIYGKYQP